MTTHPGFSPYLLVKWLEPWTTTIRPNAPSRLPLCQLHVCWSHAVCSMPSTDKFILRVKVCEPLVGGAAISDESNTRLTLTPTQSKWTLTYSLQHVLTAFHCSVEARRSSWRPPPTQPTPPLPSPSLTHSLSPTHKCNMPTHTHTHTHTHVPVSKIITLLIQSLKHCCFNGAVKVMARCHSDTGDCKRSLSPRAVPTGR